MKNTIYLQICKKKYSKAENVQRRACFVNVKVVKWFYL